ncbi:MAG: S-layer homology domain-containing protein [Bacillota bacterium]|nr:S-layer homology domain-containing protein [Bacillota bacterium]
MQLRCLHPKLGESDNNTDFKDMELFPQWAKGSVNKLYELKLLKGYADGNLKPLDRATRAEMCSLISKLIK